MSGDSSGHNVEPRFQTGKQNDGSSPQWDCLTHAAISAWLARVSRSTDAHECADEVLAGHASAGAVIQSSFTLIIVWKTNSKLGKVTEVVLYACTCVTPKLQLKTLPRLALKSAVQTGMCWKGLVVCLELECKQWRCRHWEVPSVSALPSKYNCCYGSLAICEGWGINSDSDGYSFQSVSSSLETQNTRGSRRDSVLCNLMGPACLSLWGTWFILYRHFSVNRPWLRELESNEWVIWPPYLYTSFRPRAECILWGIYTRTSPPRWHSGRRTAEDSGRTRWCLRKDKEETSHGCGTGM